jgi:hypothetical protein
VNDLTDKAQRVVRTALRFLRLRDDGCSDSAAVSAAARRSSSRSRQRDVNQAFVSSRL